MRPIATIDCETDPFLFGRIPLPFVWGFYSESGFEIFYSTNQLINRIKNFKGIIYAHNGGKFDYHYLLDTLEPEQEILIINGRIAKFKIGEAELRDSWLNLPVPLAAYKKDEIDYSKFEKSVRDKHMPEIVKYLEGDCKYLYDILKTQIDDYGLKISLPSSAFNFWHKNFSNIDKIPKSSKSFFNKFKPFYYGGRVECFQKGVFHGRFKSFDINSAYPFAMQHEHPFGDKYSVLSKLPKKISDIKKSFIIITCESIGAFPFREKTGLSFPNSNETKTFFITGWEYLAAINVGNLKNYKIETVYTFEQTINFKDYVEHFFNQKAAFKNIDEARYLLAKLYMNSLYGKFAMDGSDHIEYMTCEPEDVMDYIDAGMYFCGELGNLALVGKDVPEERQSFYNVATAASITGFVRAYLFEHIKKAKGVMYCDTDSITCEDLPCNIGKKLGEWENEGIYTSGAIAGKKMYAYKYDEKFRKEKNIDKRYKIASKGVKFTEKEIFAIAEGKKIIYKKDAPSFSITKPADFQAALLEKESVANDKLFITREIQLT